MSKPPPSRIELHLRSRKIIADGSEAIEVIRWPVRMLIVAIAIGILVSSICLLAAVGYMRGFLKPEVNLVHHAHVVIGVDNLIALCPSGRTYSYSMQPLARSIDHLM